jgi:acetyl-CoA carboxylase biotin carboxylase subunit
MGVRVESAMYDQYTVLPNYDSMIGKLIVHAETRQEAIKRMSNALDEYIIEGIKTTIPFHKKMMHNKDFIDGNFDTNFLERNKV